MCLSEKEKINIPNIAKTLPKAVCARNFNRIRKAHLFVQPLFLRGSYTLEAVAVLPLTAALWMFILFFIRVIEVQGAVQEALYTAGRQAAVEACVTDQDAALLVSGELLFRSELAQYPVVEQFVSGGRAGISLLGSKTAGDQVVLTAHYRIGWPLGFFEVKGIWISQSCYCRKWTGMHLSVDGGSSGDGAFVYYTEYGEVYHTTKECHYLQLSIHSASADAISYYRNKSGHIYYPCAGCHAGGSSAGTVYYTDYGEVYHSSLSCSGLKRSIHVLPKEEATGKGFCKGCGG